MPVSSIASSTTPAASTSSSSSTAGNTGFNALTTNDFMKLLITQLKNQDPTQPVGNDELLQQLSAMRSIQSNVDLSSTLKDLSQNQQVSSAAAFLGKIVTGKNAAQTEITGIADRVFIRDGQTILGVGQDEIPLSSVTGVSLTGAQAA